MGFEVIIPEMKIVTQKGKTYHYPYLMYRHAQEKVLASISFINTNDDNIKKEATLMAVAHELVHNHPREIAVTLDYPPMMGIEKRFICLFIYGMNLTEITKGEEQGRMQCWFALLFSYDQNGIDRIPFKNDEVTDFLLNQFTEGLRDAKECIIDQMPGDELAKVLEQLVLNGKRASDE